MPLGCIVCTALIVSQPLVYPYTNGNFGHSRVVSIYYSVGLLSLLASTNRAIPTSLRTWSERQCRASRFLFVFIVLIYKISVAVVLDRKSGNGIRIGVILSKAKQPLGR